MDRTRTIHLKICVTLKFLLVLLKYSDKNLLSLQQCVGAHFLVFSLWPSYD